AGYFLERALERPLPEPRATRDVDRVDVVGDAGDDRDLLLAVARGDAAGDERWKQVVHLPRLVVEPDLPEQLHALHGVFREERLVALPGRALRIAAVGQPVGFLRLRAGDRDRDRNRDVGERG